MTSVITLRERARGCGYRKPSKGGVGLYLIGAPFSAPCGRLPIALETCSACGGGIKFSRSWTWIRPRDLFGHEPAQCSLQPRAEHCDRCMMSGLMPVQAGLLWVGERYYKTPGVFLTEAIERGVSKKIPAIPRGYKPNETIVYLAHNRAITYDDGSTSPGVFASFKPQVVDLVIDDADSVPEKAERLAKRLGDYGRLVVIDPIDDQGTLENVP